MPRYAMHTWNVTPNWLPITLTTRCMLAYAKGYMHATRQGGLGKGQHRVGEPCSYMACHNCITYLMQDFFCCSVAVRHESQFVIKQHG